MMKRNILQIASIIVFAFVSQQSFAQSLLWQGKAEAWTNGNGTEANPYLIEKPEHLAYLANDIHSNSNTYTGKYFRQTADFDMNSAASYVMTPVGYSDAQPFKGYYDGDGHTVENVSLTYADSPLYSALFGYIEDAAISNLTIKNIKFNATTIVYAAPLVAYMKNSTIEKCSSKGVLTFLTGQYLGGLVGYVAGNNTISQSTNEAQINIQCETTNAYCGGICAYHDDAGILSIIDTKNDADIYVKYTNVKVSAHSYVAVGGIVGASSLGLSLLRTYNKGDILSEIQHNVDNTYVVPSGSTICTTCRISSAGRITYTTFHYYSYNFVGGLVGYLQSTYTTPLRIQECSWTGEISISSTGTYDYVHSVAGGLVGRCIASTTDNSQIDYSYATGDIIVPTGPRSTLSSMPSISGITIPGTGSTVTVSGTSTSVSTTPTLFSYTAGGLVGDFNTIKLTISNSYYAGTLTGKYIDGICRTTATASNNYFLETCGKETSTLGTAQTQAVMKSNSFPMVLNNSGTEVFITDDNNINSGYPIFYYQNLLPVTIQWLNYDGTLLSTTTVDIGQVPTYYGKTPTKPATAAETFTFSGWSPTPTAATGNTSYTAQYTSSPRKYKVTFINSNGSVLSEQEVEYGKAAVEPVTECASPTWNKDFSYITEDLVVEANWTVAPLASGNCGASTDNVKWELACDGTLTLKGTGATDIYNGANAPWQTYIDKITKVVVEQGITELGSYLFANCPNLTEASLPQSLTDISVGVFSWCTNLSHIYNYSHEPADIDESVFYKVDKTACQLHVPEGSIDLYKKAPVWKDFFNIVALPCIDYLIKGYCGDNLTDLSFVLDCSDNLHISGVGAMLNCDKDTPMPWEDYADIIKTVTIDEGVTTIGDEIFGGCTALSTVSLPTTLISIGRYAFEHCYSLENIVIPNNVSEIKEGAFFACIALKSIKVPNNVTDISEELFSSCISLETVDLPSNVLTIGDEAFYNCQKLESIALPTTVISIGKYAFNSCVALQNITLPDQVTIIEEGTFGDCSTLKTIVLSDKVTSIGQYAFMYDEQLTTIALPQSLTTIGDQAFYYCFKLNNPTLPSNLEYIGWDAFFACETMTEITIPEKVSTIGQRAFAGCAALTDVTFLREVPTAQYWLSDAFLSTTCNLHVPCGSKTAYMAYLSIDESRVTEPDPVVYLYSVTTADAAKGSAAVTSEVKTCEKHELTFLATPISGYKFAMWSDGNTDNPRTITLTSSLNLLAQFVQNACTISAAADGGTVTGTGVFETGTVVTLEAQADECYQFVRWEDGETNPKRTFTATADAVYVALFEPIKHTITITTSNASQGKIKVTR